MARKVRVEFAGAVCHVLDRGDRRAAIFRDDADRERFLTTLGEACARTGWRVHALVLMSNHYHLLLQTPQANLVAGMRWFAPPASAPALSRKASAQTTWTARFNRRHRLCGHLFQGRYKAVVVDPEERGYFATLSDYIQLNPIRARLVSLDVRLYDYRWSSYRWSAAKARRPAWFEPDGVLAELQLADHAEGRRLYARRKRERAVAELSARSRRPSPSCGAAGAWEVRVFGRECWDCWKPRAKSCGLGASWMRPCAAATEKRKSAGFCKPDCKPWG